MLEKAKRMFLLFWSAGVGECAHAVGAEVASAHLILARHARIVRVGPAFLQSRSRRQTVLYTVSAR